MAILSNRGPHGNRGDSDSGGDGTFIIVFARGDGDGGATHPASPAAVDAAAAVVVAVVAVGVAAWHCSLVLTQVVTLHT